MKKKKNSDESIQNTQEKKAIFRAKKPNGERSSLEYNKKCHFASASTLDDLFINKWVHIPCAMCITNLWDSYGGVQHTLAEAIKFLFDGKDQYRKILLLQASNAAIDFAKANLEENPNSYILMDGTGNFNSLLSEDDFVFVKENDEDGFIEYRSHEVDPLLDYALLFAMINTAETRVVEEIFLGQHEFKHSETQYLNKFFDETSFENDNTEIVSCAMSYIEAMSLGHKHFQIPTREEYDLGLYNKENITNAIGHEFCNRTLFPETIDHYIRICEFKTIEYLLLPDNVRTYIQKCRQVVQYTDDLLRIWQSGLSNSSFDLNLMKTYENKKPADKTIFMTIAKATGIDAMIDAYIDGVPIEDIVL